MNITENAASLQLPPSQAGKVRRKVAPSYDPALVGINPPGLADLSTMRSNSRLFASLITDPNQKAGSEARTTFDNLLSRSNQVLAVEQDGQIFVAPNKWATRDWSQIPPSHWLDAYDAHREVMNAGEGFTRAKRETTGIIMDTKTEDLARAAWHTVNSARGRKAKIVFDIVFLGKLPATTLVETASLETLPDTVAPADQGLAVRIVKECLPHLSLAERLTVIEMLHSTALTSK